MSDVFDRCRYCGTELSYRGYYEPIRWLDSALESACPDGRQHEPISGVVDD